MSAAARERWAAAMLLALVAARAGWGLATDASVADEHPHILAGWLYWQSGRYAGGFDNPPLGQLLVALPLHVLRLPYAFASDAYLGFARAPVVMALVALGFLLWRWGRALGGPAVGLAAIAMLAVEPNLVAHGHLSTLDAPLTVAWWGTLWAWRAALLGGLESRRVLVFALVAAVATLVKFTGLLLYPAALAVAFASPGVRRWRATLAVALAVVVAWLLAWMACGFGSLASGLPEPLAAALRGKLEHRDEVRFAYLAGKRSEHGFLAYYLVALALKTPLPLLALAAWGAVRRQARRERLLIGVPALAVLVAFTLARVNVGVRHVLPVLPALLVWAALGAVDLARRGRPGRILVAALAAAWVAGVARVAPQDLAYFNALAGGPAGGHRFLIDSNLAWGQDDGRLQAFLARAQARGESWDVLPAPLVPKTGHLAVECNALHNLNRTSLRPYEWLRPLRPVSFAGWSWRLYAPTPAAYAAAAHAHPGDAAAQSAWAAILRQAGEPARADSVLRAAAAADPAGIAARVARLALDDGDWRRAQEWLQHAPRDPEIASLTQRAALQAALATASADAAPAAALALGLWYAERDDIERALPLLARAAAARPDDAEAQRAHAVALAHAGRWGEAAAILSRPDLARDFAAELDLVAALAAADDFVAQHGVSATSGATMDHALLFELGRAHFEARRYERAAPVFARILVEDPGARVALAYLGEMQVRCKMRIVAQTLPELRIVPRRAAGRGRQEARASRAW